MFNVVLVEPEIPPNTGNIARLCLAADAHLHLVRPLGFSLDDKYLRRAGMDYWEQVKVTVWENWDALYAAHLAHHRHFLLTTKTDRPYYEETFEPGDFLVFGRETRGLPESLLTSAGRKRLLTIPMAPGGAQPEPRYGGGHRAVRGAAAGARQHDVRRGRLSAYFRS